MYRELLRKTLAPLKDHEQQHGIDFCSSITSAAILFEELLSRACVELVPPQLGPVDFEKLAFSMSQAIEQHMSTATVPMHLLEKFVVDMRQLLDTWNEASLSEEEIREYRAMLAEASP